MPDTTYPPGCGRLLAADGPHPVECGEVDAFGIRQFCHSCNARLYYHRQRREATPARLASPSPTGEP